MPSEFKFCYMDTDRMVYLLFYKKLENIYEIYLLEVHSLLSLLVASSGSSLDAIVKEEKKQEWFDKIRPAWFSTDSPRSQKCPGLLKSEFSTMSGMFIGLR